MAGVGSEAREIDTTDERMVLERFGDSGSVLFVALHSELECFESAQSEPTVERGRDRAGGILQKLDWLKDGWILGEGRTLNQVRVACKVLRNAVNDDVDAKLERPLKTGGGERVVDDHERAAGCAPGG